MIPSSFTDVLRDRKLQKTIMVLCFIYAIVMGVLFTYQVYAFTLKDTPAAPGPNPNPPQNQSTQIRQPPRDDMLRGISNDSPAILAFSFIGMIIATLAGLVIYENTFVTERKELKTKAIKGVLLPDEQKIITLLEEAMGELTQTELVIKSELSKLKVSRILQKMESTGVIKKYPYGKTNRILLKHADEIDKKPDSKVED